MNTYTAEAIREREKRALAATKGELGEMTELMRKQGNRSVRQGFFNQWMRCSKRVKCSVRAAEGTEEIKSAWKEGARVDLG